MKKTYIPSIPRSRKLKSVGGGTINVSGGSAQNVPVIEGHTHDNKIILDAITQLHLRILSSLNVDEDGALIVELSNIIKELDTTVPTDENLFSALRTVLEIRARSISKTDPDTAQEIITFLKGIIASGTSKFDNIEVGDYTTGPLGAGAAIKMENGVSRLEVDNLDVRMRATFRELIIESLKHIGGQLILSPARMKCTSVVDGGTYYRCYFDTGDGKVSNEFVAGDQARCQVFTGSGVKMYWRLVTSVGTDWINLSKTDAISGSSIPEAGDDIVQLGNRTDATRQNAQILSTVGSDAPSWKQYKGINAFSLEGKDTTVFSGTGNKIDGKTVFMSSGANVEDGINSKNSNYSSQPTSYKANDTWTLSADQTVNGVAYKSGDILTATQDSTAFVQAHWVKKVRYTDDSAVNNIRGGVNLLLQSDSYDKTSIASNNSSQYPISKTNMDEGSRKFVRIKRTNTTLNPTIISLYNTIQLTALSQSVAGKEITISFDARVNLATTSTLSAVEYTPAKSLSDNGKTINLTTEWTRYYTTFVVSSDLTGGFRFCPFTIQIAGDINDFYLDISRFAVKFGNIKDEWDVAPEDVDAKIADTKLYVEYSTNGTSWHTTFQTNDIYMRQKTGVNGTWTGAIKIVGKDGTSVSIKGKVPTSASLPSSASLGDGYIAEDTGHLRVWTGSWTDAGQIQGDNGANSYIHIAYADDSLGGGFSHNPSGKSWIGIYADFTAIDSDTPSDYTWMYAKGQQGDQGVSISSITPKYAVSTDGANPPISWSNTVPTKAWNEYMWQYEIIAYSNSTTFETAKRVVSGINGADGSNGADGADGADGISILSVTPEYAVNSNNATAPTTFYTTPPSRAAGQYLWVREKIEYSSGDPSYTSARVVTGDKGDTGASAPLLYLSASAQVMKCNPDNTPQTGQTISIEAKLQNVSGTATFVATPYNDAGTALTAITLGGSGNTRTLTNSQWLAAYKRIEVVATLGSLTDKVTIYRVADGATGKGISGTEIKYQVGTSGTTAPIGTWLTSVPTVPEGQFLWTRTITSYTDSTSTTSYSVSKQGVSGSDGKGISSTVITYQAGSSGTVVPTGTWSGTIPSVSENQYLWTRTVITYTDSSTSTSYSVGKMGAKGEKGDQGLQGIQGEKGSDGATYYTWVRYADTPTTGMSQYPTGKAYIGFAYNKTTPTESSVYSDYKWSLIKGEQGIPGDKGADGTQYYTWIKYADTPTTGMSDSPTGKAYIGIAVNKTTATESTNYADYTWQLTKGDAGQNAIVGLLTNESVTLQANNAGTVSSFAPANGEFWVYNGVTKVTSGITFSKVSETGCTAAITSAGAYSVSAMSADNATVVLRAVYSGVTIDKVLTLSKSRAGADGVSITGVDVEFAKNTTPETAPTTGWTTTAQTLLDGEQLWTRTKTTYSAGNPTYSTPANITPKKGDTGAVGQGIDSVTEEYAISTSKTVQPTTGWSTTQPAWSNGQYIWSRVKVVYKNPAQTIYTGYAVSSEWEAVNDLEIGGRNLITDRHSIIFNGADYPTHTSAVSELNSNRERENTVTAILGTGENKAYRYVFITSKFSAFPQAKKHVYSFDYKTNHIGGAITIDIRTPAIQAIFYAPNTNETWRRGYVVADWTGKTTQNSSLVSLRPSDSSIGNYISIRNLKLVEGEKGWDDSPAPEDVQAEIDAVQSSVNTVSNSVTNLNTYIDGAFKDGLIDEAEAKAIEKYLNTINETMAKAEASYNKVYANTYLEGDPKTALLNAKINLWGQRDTLLSAINTAIAGGTTTPAQKTAVDNAFTSFNSLMSAFQSALEEANKAIQNKLKSYADAAQDTADDAAAVAADAQAKANVSKAVTDTFKTTINGGLISTVMILLRELNSIIETAGISGIQDDGYSPAYWSGGTYAAALAFGELMRAVDRGDNPIASVTLNAKMSSIVMLHNGHAKVGELIIKSNGQIIILDKATGKIKFVINSQDIPSVADLMSGTTFGETKTNPSVSGITGIVTLQNTISVDKNNSTLSFAADISLTLRNYTKTADASMSVDLFKNGVLYLNLGSLSVVKLDESTPPVTDSYSISKTISGIPTGTYSVKITVVASGDVRDYAGSISASTLAWNFTQSGVRYFQLGLNGLMAYYSDNHFHYTETGGLDVRGATNMPGVLFGATIGSNGAMGSWWGAKKHALKTSEKVSGLTGTYDIFHSIGHSNYQITGNAYGNRTLSIISKSNDSCRVAIYNGTTLIDNQFDIVFIGNNY